MSKNSESRRLLRVFLCHSSGDKQAVRDLHVRLRSDGVEPWLDEEELLAGQDWQQEIPKAVRQADAVIVCLSRSSINKAGYVQKELKYALDVSDEQPEGAIFIIPLRLEDCSVPERLRRWHWVDLFDQRGYERLVAALTFRADTLGIAILPTRNATHGTEPSQVELYLAEVVQRVLLPTYPAETNSLEIATMHRSVGFVGADYYDFIRLSDSTLGIALADVSGKGMAAVLLALTLRVALRTLVSSENMSPALLLGSLNQQMFSLIERNQFAALFYGQYEEKTRLLTYVTAGHSSPILIRLSNAIEPKVSEREVSVRQDDSFGQPFEDLRTGGIPLGMLASWHYEEKTILLQSGDVLVAYTDGLTEALNPETEQFGENQLHKVVQPLIHLTAKEIGENIIESIDAWRGERPLVDDLAVIVLKAK